MKLSGSRLLAAASLVLLACTARAATRPRIGGTLRIAMQARVSSLDPRSEDDAGDHGAWTNLQALLFDRLAVLDAKGLPQPALAVAWEHDARFVKWLFKLRPGVKWHDGAALNPSDVLAALEGAVPNLRMRLDGETLEISSADPAPDLLLRLATEREFEIRRPRSDAAGGLPIGTGPFRLAEWQPGRRAVFEANEDYWAGRPFVNRVEIEMGRPSKDQLLDLEVDRTDIVRLDPSEARRAQQDGRKIWISSPVELLILTIRSDNPRTQDQRLREAIARSIDRAAIQKVLLQNYGETLGGLFPQWLSGYSFLFPVAADLERARQRKAELGSLPTLRLGYDADDPLARQVAERVAVNARDAGLILQAAPLAHPQKGGAKTSPEIEILRRRIEGPSLRAAARGFNRWLPFLEGPLDQPEAIFAAEKRLLDGFTVVPLACVPEIIGVGPRVRNWNATRWGEWRLDDVWLEAEKP